MSAEADLLAVRLQTSPADLHRSPSEALSSTSSRSRSASSLSSRAPSDGGVLESIQQAIALLQNAVLANRVTHFQPSTAWFVPPSLPPSSCQLTHRHSVISSVRTVLSSTDCLTRESSILKRHPTLAIERKRILSSLAALVNQARNASSLNATDEDRIESTELMLSTAESVSTNVYSFLSVAAKLGVRLAEQDRAGHGSELGADLRGSGTMAIREPPDLRGAKSVGDLRSRKRPQLSIVAHTNPLSRPGSYSPSLPSPSFRDSAPSPILRHSGNLVVRSTSELILILSTIHDHLLSTIAAFIGHVHAHTRASHSSSYAYLIDMTRETIEQVRELLVVVEAVSRHPSLPAARAASLPALATSREHLYVATTALVTAAWVATSTPEEGSAEDDERRSLLGSATAVLRLGGECVGAVKACIVAPGQGDDLFELVVPEMERVEEERASSAFERVEERSPRSVRAGHTLSMLGRKATSLSCLRDRYEEGGEMVGEEEEEEEAEEERLRDAEEDDYPRETSDDEREASQTPLPTHGRNASDSSSFGAGHGRGKSISSLASQGHTRKRSVSSSNGANSEATITSARSSPSGTAAVVRSSVSSRASSTTRGASVPMSRGESSRTSNSAASSRSAFSHTSTAGTSPRTSAEPVKHEPVLAFPLLAKGTRSPRSAVFPPPPLPSPLSAPQDGPPTPKNGSAWFLERDYEAREISFNGDGHVTGGTLRCLIERMTLHDKTIDPTFSNTFLLTFRMFTHPSELADALFSRFDISPPSSPSFRPEDLKVWTDSKATPVRLRVYNLFKMWLESYWHHDTDSVVIDRLLAFSRDRLATTMPSASQRLIDLVQKRLTAVATTPEPRGGLTKTKSSERMRAGRIVGMADPYSSLGGRGTLPPASVLSKTLLVNLRTLPRTAISVLEIDPLELARQLTILESRLYCAIKPEELLSKDFSRKASIAVNVRAMSTLSTRLTGWVAETILNEQDAKKRTTLIKYFLKLCDVRFSLFFVGLPLIVSCSQRCLSLDNYNTLMAVLCALNSSTISRLKKTWDGLSSKYRISLEVLRRATEHGRNHAEYRSRIRSAVPPALPFLGLFLCILFLPFFFSSVADAGFDAVPTSHSATKATPPTDPPPSNPLSA